MIPVFLTIALMFGLCIHDDASALSFADYGKEQALKNAERARQCDLELKAVPVVYEFVARSEADKALRMEWKSQVEVCLVNTKTKQTVNCQIISESEANTMDEVCAY